MILQTILRRLPDLETWLFRRLVVGTMDLRDDYWQVYRVEGRRNI